MIEKEFEMTENLEEIQFEHVEFVNIKGIYLDSIKHTPFMGSYFLLHNKQYKKRKVLFKVVFIW